MWGKSQLNRRNIVLVALTTSTAALALAGPVQAQEAAPSVPTPTQAASVDMVKARVLKLKDPDGNTPDEVAVRCARTATQAGRKCTVKVEYPALECTDATVMATLRTTAGVNKPVVVGLKLRCIRTVDLEDTSADDDTTTPAPATPAPAAQTPAPVQQQTPPPAAVETPEQRAARQMQEELGG
jgi:hypothetical protein